MQIRNNALSLEVEDLKWGLELNAATIKQKNLESKHRKQETRELKEKVSELEKALSCMVCNFSLFISCSKAHII